MKDPELPPERSIPAVGDKVTQKITQNGRELTAIGTITVVYTGFVGISFSDPPKPDCAIGFNTYFLSRNPERSDDNTKPQWILQWLSSDDTMSVNVVIVSSRQAVSRAA